MNTDLHFSSKTDLWETPIHIFNKLNETHKFTLDVCANAENTKCILFFDKSIDGLTQPWTGSCWMNPPYGREIGKWVKKAFESSIGETSVVCLLPARTDTKWFHEYCVHGEIEFIKGRLKFGGHKNPAPFPSMIVTFRNTENKI